jgi:hypothetical protein
MNYIKLLEMNFLSGIPFLEADKTQDLPTKI